MKTIEEASLTTSNQIVGESLKNLATLTFTPVAPISVASGKIEIEAPVWAAQYLDGEFVDQYPFD